MAFTYDPSTSRGRVRLMIPDRRPDEAIFSDVEIDTFLNIEGDSIKRAAALALETIAADEALVQKVMTRLDLSTNGAAITALIPNPFRAYCSRTAKRTWKTPA